MAKEDEKPAEEPKVEAEKPEKARPVESARAMQKRLGEETAKHRGRYG